MSKIKIVTDSAALFFNPAIVRTHDITVAPIYVRFGGERYKLGLEIGPEEFLYRMRDLGAPPRLEAPTTEEFQAIYSRLNRDTNKIISLHLSTHLGDAVKHATLASKMFLGRCDIEVIDSQTLSAGLAMLVEKAAKLTHETNDFEEVVRGVRKAISRVYAVFYVETMKTIGYHRLIGEAQTILGAMLGIMPFLTVEEGQLVVMEKALNTTQAIDKLAEFASEFAEIEQLVILHHSNMLTEPVRQLQDRLALELSMPNCPTLLYDGSVAAFLGTDATGVVILEGEEEEDLISDENQNRRR
jgi:DegV family protein with EDD domain